MKFLQKSLDELLIQHPDLSEVNLVLPGKRPLVFIKKILEGKKYSGFLPQFITIEDLIAEIAQTQELKGIGLWLFGYQVYRKVDPRENFADFLKWFPTLIKDWDDILKFTETDLGVLQYMLDEERIKNWGETLGDENTPRQKNLNFWRKMNIFLPKLKEELKSNQLATSGMVSVQARDKLTTFAQNTQQYFAFLGFNAFTPTEEKLVKTLLQWDKATCFFHADTYYMEDERQEAGKFLRAHKKWKEFNDHRDFKWLEQEFDTSKTIKVYEVPGNIAQAKLLPTLLKDQENLEDTALVLLDENLLPATLESLGDVGNLNITMGFPLKNLTFSNAVKQVFYLQKQLHKKDSSYYYNDLFSILEQIPKIEQDQDLCIHFKKTVEERNMIYISAKKLAEELSELSFFSFLIKQNPRDLLDLWIDFCAGLLQKEMHDDVLYENIAHFEKSFKIIRNQLAPYDFEMDIETLEVLINQLINSETIDFQGEPLQGLQVMGLLETRLLNFKTIILLSVNEGKLPLGNTQNTYLPFDVRQQFGLNTFLENDSIYAYHFYRLLQGAENIYLLFNALTSGVNVGEKSRFITQMEMESKHKIENFIVETPTQPADKQLMVFHKDQQVLEKLELWKERVSVSNFNTYLYNPIDFYFSKVLGLREADEMEEEVSQRNYGSLIHHALEFLYGKIIGKVLHIKDLEGLLQQKEEALTRAIEHLKQQPEYYERGINYIHKALASKVIDDILKYDLSLIKKGATLEILAIEKKFEGIPFVLDANTGDQIKLVGVIDRIDRLDGTLRIIDYKTAKTKNLNVKIEEKNLDTYFFDSSRKQALQLCVYQYVMHLLVEYQGEDFLPGIWSFADVGAGVNALSFTNCGVNEAMVSVKNIVLEILNPEIPFVEKINYQLD